MSAERDTAVPLADDAPHPGCNCGRRRAAPVEPLLRPDLVIAARDRAREPELAEATVARALATPLVPRLAKYDVIVLASDDDTTPEHRLISEFARHEHRVFVLHNSPRSRSAPAAPSVTHIDFAADGADPIFTLANLRREHTIEAAAVILPSAVDPAFSRYLRDRWGWRIVALADRVMRSEAKHLGSNELLGSGTPRSSAAAQDGTGAGLSS